MLNPTLVQVITKNRAKKDKTAGNCCLLAAQKKMV